MHFSDSKSRESKQSSHYTTPYSKEKIYDNFRCWPTANNFMSKTKFFYFNLNYDEDNPCLLKNTEAFFLKLSNAGSKPNSRVFSSVIRTIIDMKKYAQPITMQVDLSPKDSSLLKYCIVSDESIFLN